MLARRPRSRRVYSVLALATLFLGGAVEPVVGWMQDGAVHHESRSGAAAHRISGVAGEHGHEDGGAIMADQEHTPSHQHGTGQDHCTHAHGPFVGGTTGFAWPVLVRTVSDPFVMHELAGPSSHAPPPPKT